MAPGLTKEKVGLRPLPGPVSFLVDGFEGPAISGGYLALCDRALPGSG
jgi:hypothetical protein